MRYDPNIARRIKYAIIFILCILNSVAAVQAQINYTVTFDPTKLTYATDTVGGNSYTRLHYTAIDVSGETGTPELPVHYLQFSVPYNAVNFTVTVIDQTLAPFASITGRIYPVQPPVTPSMAKPVFVHPDNTIYNSSQWPETPVYIVNDGFYDGDNHIVTVAVSPVNYIPSTGEIQLRTLINLQLSYTTQNGLSSDNSGKHQAISRPLLSQREFGRSQAKQMVVNPEQVDQFAPIVNRVVTRTSTSLPVYEYCVITNRELAPAFDRLINWKRQKGYNAGVVCIEDILEATEFQNGDEVSRINDNAGKLRAYLRYTYYQDGSAKFVLLGGKPPIVPLRYGHSSNYASTSIVPNQYLMPSDLYFSDLNGNWNVDGDSHYGEPTDAVDSNPELFVGRILCQTMEEVENYTEKLLCYERNPGNGDYTYLKKAFYTQSDQMQADYQEAQILSNSLSSIFTTHTIFEEVPSGSHPLPTFPTGKQVIDEMNNRYGFFSWHGHGSPEGMAVKSNGIMTGSAYGIIALEDQYKYLQREVGNGLNNLTNYNHPAICYSESCTLTPYDIFAPLVDGKPDIYDVRYNVGESFTVGGLYGGPAFLGNTREGFIVDGFLLEKKFFQYLLNGNYSLGIAEANSKSRSIAPMVGYRASLIHSLIGCPEFEMWTDTPYTYTSFSTANNDNTITIYSIQPSATGSKVSAMSESGTPIIQEISNNLTLSNISLNRPITIYKHNCIPYVLPLSLQNESIATSQYLFAGTVSIGSNVDTSRTPGNYILANGGDITIEASDSINIQPGFIIQSGGKVTQKCKQGVNITGCEIKAGGSMIIDAVTTNINNGFVIEKGAVMEIKKFKSVDL